MGKYKKPFFDLYPIIFLTRRQYYDANAFVEPACNVSFSISEMPSHILGIFNYSRSAITNHIVSYSPNSKFFFQRHQLYMYNKMVWPFSSSSPSTSNPKEALDSAGSQDVLESVDPSLRKFYEDALPVKPLSLAPQELKDRVASEQKMKQVSLKAATIAFNDTEMNSQRRRFVDAGGNYIQTLWEAANENCAILGAKYGECQRHGPMWSVMMSCRKESEDHRACLGLQRNALMKLGFDQAMDSQQRNMMKYKLDDLYTKYFPDGTVTEAAKKEFLAEVDVERAEIAKNLYRL